MTGADDPGFKADCVRDSLSVNPGESGYQAFFRAAEGEGGEQEGRHPAYITVLRVQSDFNSQFLTRPLAQGRT